MVEGITLTMLLANHVQSLWTLIHGFLLCASLLVAIGPQNLFILQQGLRGRYLFATASLCVFCDLLLVTLGVAGVGTAIAANTQLLMISTFGGATFLFGYGVHSFHSACVVSALPDQRLDEATLVGLKRVILTTLSFSLLNPGAYIDTLLMIGATSGRYPFDERLFFGAGALIASTLWFFMLIYGASRLQPLFRRPLALRILDLISSFTMVGIAASMTLTQPFWFW